MLHISRESKSFVYTWYVRSILVLTKIASGLLREAKPTRHTEQPKLNDSTGNVRETAADNGKQEMSLAVLARAFVIVGTFESVEDSVPICD